MNERKSALDYLLEGNVFTREHTRMVPWSEYYQGVESIKLVYNEGGKDVYGHSRTLYNGQVTPIIKCSNKLCNRGGYEIERIIFEMIRNKETHREFYLDCLGQETSAKGQKVYGDCENEADFEIDIQLKEEAPKADQ